MRKIATAGIAAILAFPVAPAFAADAEDGSNVPASFYSRTDYNRNGITDQEEPGHGLPGWEKKFKAVGTAKLRAELIAKGLDPDCYQVGDDCTPKR